MGGEIETEGESILSRTKIGLLKKAGCGGQLWAGSGRRGWPERKCKCSNAEGGKVRFSFFGVVDLHKCSR